MNEMLIIIMMVLNLYLSIIALTIFSEKRQTITADEAEIAMYSNRWNLVSSHYSRMAKPATNES